MALDIGRHCGAEVVTAEREHGLLINAPRAHLLRFMPSLTVSRAEIDEAMARLDATLGEVARAA